MQVSALKEDLTQAKAEEALREEREQLQQLEVCIPPPPPPLRLPLPRSRTEPVSPDSQIIELQRQRNELQQEIDKVNDEHRAALEPQIQALEQDVARLRLEIADEVPKVQEAQSEVRPAAPFPATENAPMPWREEAEGGRRVDPPFGRELGRFQSSRRSNHSRSLSRSATVGGMGCADLPLGSS